MKYFDSPAHKALQALPQPYHLRKLLQDSARCDSLILSSKLGQDKQPVIADFSRHSVSSSEVVLLEQLAGDVALMEKVQAMCRGDKMNNTENRAVLHTACRAPRGAGIQVDGCDVMGEVHGVLDRIEAFADKVRSGSYLGATGKQLTDTLVVGIGGSALGTEFVLEALKHDKSVDCIGRRVHILANVDPIDISRSLEGFSPETTLLIICSKTFTTAETMMNARAARQWLSDGLAENSGGLSKHLVAVSTNLELTQKFGISSENVFGFWDWVGGRFSVCSSVGMLPLTLMFGKEAMRKFREGAHAMDEHFRTAPPRENIPVMMGLIAFYNITYRGHDSCAVLPYCQALHRLPAHIQQMCMESNGKQCQKDGTPIPDATGEVFFGEPGTNGQHSFYQLMHQGRTIPADFIGFGKSQCPTMTDPQGVSNHDELMCNFFAQPDALALGKTAEELKASGCPESLIPHKTFTGDRPSTVLLFPELNPFHCGVILALYEARTAVQGFIWDLNSFDQWGVELGKVLAGNVRGYFAGQSDRMQGSPVSIDSFVHPTQKMLSHYSDLYLAK